MPPSRPGDALIRPATLPRNAGAGPWSAGWLREAQSIVFLSSGASELLYSGEAIRKPSCSAMSWRNR
jgi:hypothetical protein